MANSDFYLPLQSDVGIQRDGTKFDSTLHSDGSWTRFYRGRPQKIGGMQLIARGNQEIIRSMFSYDDDGYSYFYLGRESSLTFLQIYGDLTTSPETDVTPGTPFVADVQNNWVFDSIAYQTDSGTVTYVLANCSPDLLDLGDRGEFPIYYGVLGSSDPFIPIVDLSTGVTISTSGAMICIGSFIVLFGNDGFVKWNDGKTITGWPTANVAQLGTSKLVAAAAVRSGQTASAIIWSLNSVILIAVNPNFIQGDPVSSEFQLSYAATRATLISSKAIASFDPYFYWVGSDSFWTYNGAVQELPNNVNKQWFFENINPNEKGKTYAFAVTKWNEIWFCFCKGTATECNHAVVYNIQTGNWYDTDQIYRASGLPAGSVVPYPILTSSVPVQNGGNQYYPIYAHEIGTDLVQFGQTIPIIASITSKNFNFWVQQPSMKILNLDSVILDVKQEGNMYFYITYQGYPNSIAHQTDNFNFTSATQFLTTRIKGSIFTITFVSNVINGNFVMGNTLLHMQIADDQRPGPQS